MNWRSPKSLGLTSLTQIRIRGTWKRDGTFSWHFFPLMEISMDYGSCSLPACACHHHSSAGLPSKIFLELVSAPFMFLTMPDRDDALGGLGQGRRSISGIRTLLLPLIIKFKDGKPQTSLRASANFGSKKFIFIFPLIMQELLFNVGLDHVAVRRFDDAHWAAGETNTPLAFLAWHGTPHSSSGHPASGPKRAMSEISGKRIRPVISVFQNRNREF
ncbi:hypothetical protein QBC38DRAFT_233065 [Podospora fimiseda]|uniref:Uncharacterized protein n=1 Tax=Podospora fimiseda TaxID=252190 RepID=A0AAN7BNT7_9PEZI|nr:hypothetical protein QBC38DRAFT_233065 [Podospora fimiseda]